MTFWEWWDSWIAVPWRDAVWPWISGWLQSPGFGGVAALGAAIVAFRAAMRQVKATRKQHELTEQQIMLSTWWQRAEWALNLYTSDDSTPQEREVGAEALEALAQSKIGGPDERAFVQAAMVAITLDLAGDGVDTDDVALAEGGEEGAYLAQEKGGEHDAH